MDMVGGAGKKVSPFAGERPEMAAVAEDAPAIRAVGLVKKFGAFTAANDNSFEVPPGRVFGLLGPNGAGKSTTFRMLCGLLRPTAGECFVAGVNLLHAGSAARARLGYMAQAFSLYPDISVSANIRIMADLYGLAPAARRERAELLTDALELGPFLHQKAGALPLGQKRRLALLCATLHNPPVLFLDEPTSGVDARTRREFWKHINAMTKAGVAVLVTTHFMEEAEYCDQIALIYRGSVITRGAPDELKAACPRKEGEDPGLEDAFIACIEEHDLLHPL
jgi:ABC-2 type transport system ATP-binding protein